MAARAFLYGKAEFTTYEQGGEKPMSPDQKLTDFQNFGAYRHLLIERIPELFEFLKSDHKHRF